jgi:hypothetical protein
VKFAWDDASARSPIGAELETMRIKGPEFYREGCPNAQKRLAFPSKESVSV